MALKRLSNAKKSLYNYIKGVIETGTSYTIGTGDGDLKLLEQYPVFPLGFTLPAIAIDIEKISLRSNYDLGQSAAYEYDFGIDIYARSNLEREYLVEVIGDSVEKNSVPLYDYNASTEISTMELVGYDGGPVRSQSASDDEKFKFELTLTLRTILDYQ